MTVEEIAAVASLAGKSRIVGFQPEEVLTTEKLWSACCGLMGDGMLTQIDGKFRLNRELMAVMQPICQARSVVTLTPVSDLYAQLVLYNADTLTVMKKTPFGRIALTALAPKEGARMIADHMGLSEPEYLPEEEDLPPEITVNPGSSQQELLAGAQFLLERLDPETGVRTGWLRFVQQGVLSWLQWDEEEKILCQPFTMQLLSRWLLQEEEKQ
ncbi:MAG: hypothetical protein IJO45_03165 [Oscillospiraceae bacterium]|nr:hypothetical protein [Oscillospiraceae bacterium]